MKPDKLKCRKCHKEFPRAEMTNVSKVGGYVYYCPSCVQEGLEKNEIYEYIKTLGDYNFMMVERQLENMMKENPERIAQGLPPYTYTGIKRCLEWFFGIEKNTWQSDKGIAIVTYIYDQVYNKAKAEFDIKIENAKVVLDTTPKVMKFSMERARVRRPSHWA